MNPSPVQSLGSGIGNPFLPGILTTVNFIDIYGEKTKIQTDGTRPHAPRHRAETSRRQLYLQTQSTPIANQITKTQQNPISGGHQNPPQMP